MSPAGSFASLQAAIDAGCDSVYFGVAQLNMRARAANNFSLEDLQEIVYRCNKKKVKTYLTMNTLIYQHDLKLMEKILLEAKKQNVNAVIASDMAVILKAREIKLSVHASTQLSISNFPSVKYYSQFADTIVLARELDLQMITDITNQIKKESVCGPDGNLVKIEIFGHGALCIAQSGRCHMSLFQDNASAERGACLQPCRSKYEIINKENGKKMVIENGFVLSPQDLSTINIIEQIQAAGVSVLKIEGRGREPLYVRRVTEAYRQAIDTLLSGLPLKNQMLHWQNKLKTVYHRGSHEGYYLGKTNLELSGTEGSQATRKKHFIGKIHHYYSKAEIAEVKLQSRGIKIGDELVIMGDNTGVVEEEIKELREDGREVKYSNKKNAMMTFPVSKKVRNNDKVYVLLRQNESYIMNIAQEVPN